MRLFKNSKKFSVLLRYLYTVHLQLTGWLNPGGGHMLVLSFVGILIFLHYTSPILLYLYLYLADMAVPPKWGLFELKSLVMFHLMSPICYLKIYTVVPQGNIGVILS